MPISAVNDDQAFPQIDRKSAGGRENFLVILKTGLNNRNLFR